MLSRTAVLSMILGWGACLFAAPSFKASTSLDPVTSIHHAGQPFLVADDQQDGSESGLYARSGNDWIKIRSGKVLMDRRKGPWIEQLHITSTIPHFYSLAVVGGKLILFSSDSTEANPQSVIEIGSENAPFREVDTGRLMPFPFDLNDLSGFSVYAPQSQNGAQAIMISFKGTALGLGARDMTVVFAFDVDPTSRLARLVSGPTVVDYKFHDRDDLSRKISFSNTDRDFFVTSEIMLDQSVRNFHGSFAEHSFLLEEKIAKFVADTVSPTASGPVYAPMAYVLLKGTTAFRDPPKLEHGVGSFTFTQNYDIETGRASLVARAYGTIDTSQNVRMPGLLRVRPEPADGGPFIGGSVSNFDDSSLVIVDEKIIMFYKRDHSPTFLELGTLRELLGKDADEIETLTPVDLAGVWVPAAGANGLLVSIKLKVKRKTGEEPFLNRTWLLKLTPSRKGHLEVAHVQTVMPAFNNAEVLKERVVPKNGVPFLDISNTNAPNLAEFEAHRDPTQVAINLVDSNNALAYGYIFPAQEIAVGEGVSPLFYETYKPSPLITHSSGINLRAAQPGVGVARYVPGKLLNPFDPKGERLTLNGEGTVFTVQHPGDTNIKLDLRVQVLAVTKQTDSMVSSLVLSVTAKQYFVDQLIELPINVNAEELVNVEVLGGVGRSQWLYVLYQVKKGDTYVLRASSLRIVEDVANKALSITLPHAKPFDVAGFKEPRGWLAENVIRDVNGRLFWPLQNLEDIRSRGFTVVDLSTGAPLRPNIDQGDHVPMFDSDLRKVRLGGRDLGFAAHSSSQIQWRLRQDGVKQWLQHFRIRESALAAESMLFTDLSQLAHDVASNPEGRRRVIYVVPEGLKTQAYRHMMRLFEGQLDAHNAFRAENPELEVFMPGPSSQDQILETIGQIAREKTPTNTLVYFGLLENLEKAGRPTNQRDETLTVKLTDVTVGAGETSAATSSSPDKSVTPSPDGTSSIERTASEEKKVPHALYLLDAGDAFPYEKYQQEKVAAPVHQIWIGTESEWDKISKALSVEARYGMLDRMEVIKLPTPTVEAMVSRLANYLDSTEITRLQLEYSARRPGRTTSSASESESKHKQLEIRQQLLEVAVVRLMGLAQEKSVSPVQAFLDYFGRFATAVVDDSILRRSRTMDYAFFERILTEMFAIPLNRDVLPKNHPIMLGSSEQYPQLLAKYEFRGSYDDKAGLQNDILAQFQSDSTIAIPGSHLIIGPPGNGKSKSIDAEVKALGLRRYDFTAPKSEANQFADAFVLSVGDLFDKVENGSRTQMPVEHAIEHLYHWLSLPGSRYGFIYIDDFDKGTPEIKKRLNQMLRNLTDARNGLDVHSAWDKDAPVVRRSVRNLVLRVYMNAKEGTTATTTDAKLIEAMSSDDYKVDSSHLGRFRAKSFWNRKNSGGKRGQLRAEFQNQARQALRDRQQVRVLSSRLLEKLAQEFGGDQDARPFIGGVLSGLDAFANRNMEQGPMLFLDLTTGRNFATPGGSRVASREAIEKFILDNASAIPLVTDSWQGTIRFARQIIDAFRYNIYETFVTTIRETASISGTDRMRSDIMAPMLLSVRDHVSRYRQAPLPDYNFNPRDFMAVRSGDVQAFHKMIAEESQNVPLLPEKSPLLTPIHAQANILLGKPRRTPPKTREMVLQRAQEHIKGVLLTALSDTIMLKSLREPADIKAWLKSLKDPQEVFDRVSAELVTHMLRVINELGDPELIEMSSPEFKLATIYDLSRLYLIALERAFADLPWIQVSKFLLKSLEVASGDLVLVQSQPVQQFFYSQGTSLLRPVNSEDLAEFIDSIPVVHDMDATIRANSAEAFLSDCDTALMSRTVRK